MAQGVIETIKCEKKVGVTHVNKQASLGEGGGNGAMHTHHHWLYTSPDNVTPPPEWKPPGAVIRVGGLNSQGGDSEGGGGLVLGGGRYLGKAKREGAGQKFVLEEGQKILSRLRRTVDGQMCIRKAILSRHSVQRVQQYQKKGLRRAFLKTAATGNG